MRTTPKLNDDNRETNESQRATRGRQRRRGENSDPERNTFRGDNQAYRTLWVGISPPTLWLSTRIQLPSRERTTEAQAKVVHYSYYLRKKLLLCN